MRLKMNWSLLDVFIYSIVSSFLALVSVYSFGLLSYFQYKYTINFFIEKSNLNDLGVNADFRMSYGEFFKKVVMKLILFGLAMVVLTIFVVFFSATTLAIGSDPASIFLVSFPLLSLWFIGIFAFAVFTTNFVIDGVVSGIAVDIKTENSRI